MTESWPPPQISLLDWLRVAERAADGPFVWSRDMRLRAAANRLALDSLVATARGAIARKRSHLLADIASQDVPLMHLGAHLTTLRAHACAYKDEE